MKLRNWHIDGFGCFHDCNLPDPGLGEGLNFIIGPNEAGKSTLLDFLRYTLFGHPDGRSSKPKREPLRGGIHGGAIFYEAGKRDYRVSRWRRKSDAFQLCALDRGLETEDLLRAHTGHVTGEVFRNVFGFSLSELQALDTLKGEEIVNLIFSAAIGESAARISGAEDRLRQRAEGLFKERARARAENAPLLIALQAELVEVEGSLTEARRRAEEATGRTRQLEEIREREIRLRNEHRRVGARVADLDRLIQGWNPYVRLRKASAEIEKLGDLSDFPPNGQKRWSQLRQQTDLAAGALKDAMEEEQRLQESLAQLPEHFPLLEHEGQAERLVEEKARYETASRLAADATERLSELDQRWATVQRELGTNWAEEKVLSFDASLLSESEARQRIAPLTEGRQELKAAEARLVRMESEAKNPGKACWSENRIDAEHQWLAGFRDTVQEHERRQADLRALDVELLQADLALSDQSARERRLKKLEPLAWTAVAAGGAMAAAVGLYWIQQIEAAVVAGVFAVIFAGFAAASRWMPLSLADDLDEELPQRVRGMKAAREALQAELDEARAKWTSAAEERGLSWPPREVELMVHQKRIRQEEERLNCRRELEAAQAEVLRCKKTLEPLEADWRAFLEKRDLPPEISPETAATLFNRLKEALTLLEERRQVTRKKHDNEEAAKTYLDRVGDFLKTCCESEQDIAPDATNPSELLHRFAGIREEIERQKEAMRRRTELAERGRELSEKVAKRRTVFEGCELECAAFLKSAGCSTEADFFAFAERVELRDTYRNQVMAAEETLATVFGSGGAPNALATAWDEGARPDWESERTAAAAELEEVNRERDECIREIATIQEELRRELGSDEIAELQERVEALRAEIRGGIEEWLEVSAALHLLRETRARFEKDHQPPALAEASRLFARVTGGAYQQILISLDSNELLAATRTGAQRTVEQLSRGTLEQLFLCVRLGYIRHFQIQREVRLPLLMDDVAVNFDPARLQNVLHLLEEFAADGQQILFFTCRPDIVHSLKGEARCFSLRDHRFELEHADDRSAVTSL